MKTERERIEAAWQMEGSIRRLNLLPAVNKAVQAALVPPGGEWRCVVTPGASMRLIDWEGVQVALVNPRDDLPDRIEGEVAMGLRATPAMDRALRVIFVLAQDAANLDLIRDIARAAIDYVEQPAPAIPEPAEESE